METFPPPTEGEPLCGRELAPRGSCVTVNPSEEGAVSGDVNGSEDHGDQLAKEAREGSAGASWRWCLGMIALP